MQKFDSSGSPSPDGGAFERMAGLQRQALQSLTPEQMALLLRYVSTLRRQRHALQRTLVGGLLAGFRTVADRVVQLTQY